MQKPNLTLYNPNEFFDSIFQFAYKRHELYTHRYHNVKRPVYDPILEKYKFTNAYRVLDKTTQYLIDWISRDEDLSFEDVFFQTLLFKIFNKYETFELLDQNFGLSAKEFPYEEVIKFLNNKSLIFSNAYMLTGGQSSIGISKHEFFLYKIKEMVDDELPYKILTANSLEQTYKLLNKYERFGRFLSYQFATDLHYSNYLSDQESSFVIPGPGAMDCLSKVGEFTRAKNIFQRQDDAAIIVKEIAENQFDWFEYYEIPFQGLKGRPLQPIDIQNCMCETTKYMRNAYPEIKGSKKRTQMRKLFKPEHWWLSKPVFPKSWGAVSVRDL